MKIKYLKSLSSSEIFTHVHQSHSLWGERDTVDQRYDKLIQRLNLASPALFLMSGFVDEENRLLASLKRYYFPLRIHGKEVKCVGLGAIFTAPDFRQRGLAAKLIETVLAESKVEQGCGVSLLFSDIGVDYYKKFGFLAASAQSWSVSTLTSFFQSSSSDLEVREGRLDDIHHFIKMHTKTVSEFSIHPLRTPKTWRLFHEINQVERDLILSDGRGDLGIVSFSVNREKSLLWIEDYCVPSMDSERAAVVLHRIAFKEGCQKIAGWSLPGVQFQGAEVNVREKAIPMVSVLDSAWSVTSKDLENAYFAGMDHY